jgi:hypothetical protein
MADPVEHQRTDAVERDEDASPRPRIFTLRALGLGLLLAVLFSVLTPWNDWFLRNTYLNNHYMPLGLTLVLLLAGLVVNPLLGRLRFAAGEMVLIAVMMLGIAGITSSGLMRMLPFMMAAPARNLPANPTYSNLAERSGPDGDGPVERWQVPEQLFLGLPEQGDIDPNDPEFRYLVEGYLDGLDKKHRARQGDGSWDPDAVRIGHRTPVTYDDGTGSKTALAIASDIAVSGPTIDLRGEQWKPLVGARAGEEVQTPNGTVLVIAVGEQLIPYGAWVPILMAWLPLLLGATLACIGIGGLVRRQWQDHERLPYPIAEVTWTFMAEPEKGSRFAAIFRNKAFWAGLAIAGLIISWRGLYQYGFVPVDFQLSLDLYTTEDAPFAGHPWDQTYAPKFLFTPTIYFSIIGLTFFLALDVSFSLWFFFILTNFVFLFLRLSGVPIGTHHVGQAGVGGFAMEVILLLWIGRKYYGQVLKAAFVPGGDAKAKEAAPYLWVLLGGCFSMVAFFVWLGAPVGASILLVLLFLGFLLVLARIVAEAGIPYIGVPTGAFLNSVLFSVLGFGLPVAALIPLCTIGITLMADSREAMLPYAVNAAYLGDKAKARPRRLSGVFLLAAAVAIVVSLFTMVWLSYSGDGHPDPYANIVLKSAMLDTVAKGKEMAMSAEPTVLAQLESRNNQTWMAYGVGGAIVALLGLGRMFFTAWPFHPIGYLTSMTYATWNIWFSFFLGWLFKALVMRYGGTATFRALKPAAIGLIAGEALAGGAFMLIKMVVYLNGQQIDTFKFLPG